MGVPSFFRWLLEKYPRVIKYVKEEFVEYDDNGNRLLPDASGKNVNSFSFSFSLLCPRGLCFMRHASPTESNMTTCTWT